ncbi:lipopolysaccharide transport periplasmic protein LptA [Herbaspirillum sp. LeCh32-8]|uniref:lipopolysaccharide transport periplasmic protein LptA n=1 Tax=Herbaspirillum sp. LeCh32-8 TaxID=2821356 RepID=UPI001AE38E09|nr:lipopolysaccharide transport periplasmic protein LptA [Herbaspirillum sp. LeCh32-8]MBP0600003.1 lipopolysaccharide transport periplasmic protein LptA [Herbaspirillum sp. LeCh32-8]
MKRSLLLSMLLLAAVCGVARAEKADTTKPTNIEADQMVYDDVRQVKTFTGNVVLTRGTLLIKAGRVVLTTDQYGYEYAVLYAAPGSLASFRQKRDGGPDLWIEGQAERIEYSEQTEISKLFQRAHIQRMDGKRVTDEVNGEFISYDSRAEFYSVNNTASGESKPGAGRITAVIQPKNPPPAQPQTQPEQPAQPAKGK